MNIGIIERLILSNKNIGTNVSDIFHKNSSGIDRSLPEMTRINYPAYSTQTFPAAHTNPHIPYMMPQNNSFWPQPQQNHSQYTIHSTIVNQTNSLLRGELPQPLPIQSWPNMYVPHNRGPNAVWNGSMMTLTQQNNPLNVILNPVQFVVIVDPSQQHVINNTLVYPK